MLISQYVYSEHFLYVLLLQRYVQGSCMFKEATKMCLKCVRQLFFLVEGKHYLLRLTHHFWRHTTTLPFKDLFTVPVANVSNCGKNVKKIK